MQRYLPPEGEPWGRYVDQRLDESELAVGRLTNTVNVINRDNTSTFNRLTEDIQLLQSLSNQARQSGTDYTFSGAANSWCGGPLPNVTVSSPTGRVLLSFGSKVGGQDGYVAFEVEYNGEILVSRDTVRNSPHLRLMGSGGLAVPRDMHRAVTMSVPPDTPVKYTLNLWSTLGPEFGYFSGGSIMAQPIF